MSRKDAPHTVALSWSTRTGLRSANIPQTAVWNTATATVFAANKNPLNQTGWCSTRTR